ncbi:hypothetical protein BB561_001632 [Smittium simulii]|uniref:DUS-like FMN-binding domain-containing protein n=1 Tax=Smittium simulii TaxID=133385 RepID=A0A2T9YTY9_9FUNG|nr:hypothetical protein BB561_001632 [Smittium simulii]
MDPSKYKNSERYSQGMFLAPMVRIGTLPLRLMALEQGAALVWTPEMVDKSMIGCTRIEEGDIIKFLKNDKMVFYCHKNEKNKMVFQIGSSNPDLALEAAKVVQKFSVIGGMGAALLYNPDTLISILEKLVANIPLPITCKIRFILFTICVKENNNSDQNFCTVAKIPHFNRILPDIQETISLVKRIAKTGVSAITVHCRTVEMRNKNRAMWDRITDIINAVKPLPVVLNGDVFAFDDFFKAKKIDGISSVMVARGVYGNISVFNDSIKAEHIGNPLSNTKYLILQMYSDTKSEEYIKLSKVKTYTGYYEIFRIDKEYREKYLKSLEILKKPVEEETASRSNITPLEEAKTPETRKRGSEEHNKLVLEDKTKENNSKKSKAETGSR